MKLETAQKIVDLTYEHDQLKKMYDEWHETFTVETASDNHFVGRILTMLEPEDYRLIDKYILTKIRARIRAQKQELDKLTK